MSYTVLAIDDTKKILTIVKYFLENEGFRVLTASDPFEGIELVRKHRPDLILLDIMMPGMDGYTVKERINQDPSTAETPVIMLTAKAIIMHTPKDFFYGLYGFLAKPFSKQQLLKMVHDILKLTKAKEETRFFRSVSDDPGDEISENP